jgi:hypothetical protein
MVANEKSIGIPMGKKLPYEVVSAWRVLNNHIISQHGKERDHVTFLNDLLNLCKVLRYENASR